MLNFFYIEKDYYSINKTYLEILKNNRDMCKEHIINFVYLIDFFIKSRYILIREKIWNYYKNIEDNDIQKNVLLKHVLNYLGNDLNTVFLLFILITYGASISFLIFLILL